MSEECQIPTDIVVIVHAGGGDTLFNPKALVRLNIELTSIPTVTAATPRFSNT
jgi:hypothetical protein